MRPNFANPSGEHAEAIAAFRKVIGYFPQGTMLEDFEGVLVVVAYGRAFGTTVVVDTDGVVYDAEDLTTIP